VSYNGWGGGSRCLGEINSMDAAALHGNSHVYCVALMVMMMLLLLFRQQFDFVCQTQQMIGS
jgi:hypothetical protein